MSNPIIYSKIEVLIKPKVFWGEKDPRISSTEKLEFLKAGLSLSGNYLIISKTEPNENNEELTSSLVYPLDIVITYRTTL